MVLHRLLAVLAVAVLVAAPAHAKSGIDLSLFRAVRISDTTIALSYVSDVSSIGTISYLGSGERTVTYTDAARQIDHLFTIEDLTPSKAYSFTIKAERDEAVSDTYVVLLSPESIGEVGASITPSVQQKDADGNLVAAQLAAPATAAEQHVIPLALGIAALALGFIGWNIYRAVRKRRGI